MNPLVDNAGVTTIQARNGFEIQLGNNHQEHLYLLQNLGSHPFAGANASPGFASVSS